MSFPRLALAVLVLPLLTAACAAPVAITAASYGADGVSLVDSGKSTSDHFLSMVSKKDCAMWRILRKRDICTERPDGRDPYKVDYDQANRMPSEDGVSYAPPLHASSKTPVAAWSADAYKTDRPGSIQTAALAPPGDPAPVVAEAAPPPPATAVAAKPAKSGKPVGKKAKTHVAHHAKPVKKPSPSQVASVP